MMSLTETLASYFRRCLYANVLSIFLWQSWRSGVDFLVSCCRIVTCALMVSSSSSGRRFWNVKIRIHLSKLLSFECTNHDSNCSFALLKKTYELFLDIHHLQSSFAITTQNKYIFSSTTLILYFSCSSLYKKI